MGTREDIYDTEVNPLMKQVLEICKRTGIPLVASFRIDHGDEGDELVELLTEAVPADPHARAVLLMRVGQRLTEELVLRVAAWGQDPDSALRTEATVDSLLARALLIRGRA